MLLRCRLAATAFPIDYFVTDIQGHVFAGETEHKNPEALRMTLPKGLSYLELSVKARQVDSNGGQPIFPILAELDGTDIDLNPSR